MEIAAKLRLRLGIPESIKQKQNRWKLSVTAAKLSVCICLKHLTRAFQSVCGLFVKAVLRLPSAVRRAATEKLSSVCFLLILSHSHKMEAENERTETCCELSLLWPRISSTPESHHSSLSCSCMQTPPEAALHSPASPCFLLTCVFDKAQTTRLKAFAAFTQQQSLAHQLSSRLRRSKRCFGKWVEPAGGAQVGHRLGKRLWLFQDKQ